MSPELSLAAACLGITAVLIACGVGVVRRGLVPQGLLYVIPLVMGLSFIPRVPQASAPATGWNLISISQDTLVTLPLLGWLLLATALQGVVLFLRPPADAERRWPWRTFAVLGAAAVLTAGVAAWFSWPTLGILPASVVLGAIGPLAARSIDTPSEAAIEQRQTVVGWYLAAIGAGLACLVVWGHLQLGWGLNSQRVMEPWLAGLPWLGAVCGITGLATAVACGLGAGSRWPLAVGAIAGGSIVGVDLLSARSTFDHIAPADDVSLPELVDLSGSHTPHARLDLAHRDLCTVTRAGSEWVGLGPDCSGNNVRAVLDGSTPIVTVLELMSGRSGFYVTVRGWGPTNASAQRVLLIRRSYRTVQAVGRGDTLAVPPDSPFRPFPETVSDLRALWEQHGSLALEVDPEWTLQQVVSICVTGGPGTCELFARR